MVSVAGFLEKAAQQAVVEFVSCGDDVLVQLEIAGRNTLLPRRMILHERRGRSDRSRRSRRRRNPRADARAAIREVDATDWNSASVRMQRDRAGGLFPDRSRLRAERTARPSPERAHPGARAGRLCWEARVAGWTEPGGRGQPSLKGEKARWKRSDTITPLIGSAGWLGHQPITMLRRPFWLRMFQTALVLRERLVTGWMPSRDPAWARRSRERRGGRAACRWRWTSRAWARAAGAEWRSGRLRRIRRAAGRSAFGRRPSTAG